MVEHMSYAWSFCKTAVFEHFSPPLTDPWLSRRDCVLWSPMPTVGRRPALLLYTVALGALTALSNVGPPPPSAKTDGAVGIPPLGYFAANTLLFVPIVAACAVLLCPCRAPPPPPPGAEDAGPDPELPAAAPQHRRVALDHLKVALTALVVAGHAVGQLTGGGPWIAVGAYRSPLQPVARALGLLGQGLAMPLFFFVAGFFAPPSRDRKGARGFLRDKCRRLGLPMLATTALLEPAAEFVGGRGRFVLGFYVPTPGVAWFLCWLLVFQVQTCH